MLQEIRDKTERPLIVLDPNLDPAWDADFMTDNPEKFKETVNSNSGCQLAIDESGETIGKHAKDMMFLATRSRHRGHVATFIAQRAQQIDPNVRGQCTRLFLGIVSLNDSKLMADDWADEELRNAYTLEQGDFFVKMRNKKIFKINAFNL